LTYNPASLHNSSKKDETPQLSDLRIRKQALDKPFQQSDDFLPGPSRLAQESLEEMEQSNALHFEGFQILLASYMCSSSEEARVNPPVMERDLMRTVVLWKTI
jgi:hypothetical protein